MDRTTDFTLTWSGAGLTGTAELYVTSLGPTVHCSVPAERGELTLTSGLMRMTAGTRAVVVVSHVRTTTIVSGAHTVDVRAEAATIEDREFR